MIRLFIICFVSLFVLNGCVGIRSNNKKNREQQNIIDNLEAEVESLNLELTSIKTEKETEISRLKNTQEKLFNELRNEIKTKDAQVRMSERGLTITFLAQIFFPSGKADIKKEGEKILDKIVAPLKEIRREIRIEGHTDNIAIKHTRHLYKSNWELSSARALSVLHYFESKGLNPDLLSAAGYGEFRPIVSNATKQGRAKNRRVEIVILPKKISVVDKGVVRKPVLRTTAKKKTTCSYLK